MHRNSPPNTVTAMKHDNRQNYASIGRDTDLICRNESDNPEQ